MISKVVVFVLEKENKKKHNSSNERAQAYVYVHLQFVCLSSEVHISLSSDTQVHSIVGVKDFGFFVVSKLYVVCKKVVR